MSLINQMLKDLEARHEGDARARLHREVRPLPEVREQRTLWVALLGVLLAMVGGVVAWLLMSRSEPVPVAAPESVAVPQPQPAAVAQGAAAATAMLPAAVEQEVIPGGLKLSATLDRLPPEASPDVAVPAPSKKSASAARADEAAPRAAERPGVAGDRSGTERSGTDRSSADRASAEKGAAEKAVADKRNKGSGVVEKVPAQPTSRERSEAGYRNAVSLINAGRVNEGIDVLLDVLRQDGGHAGARQLVAKLLIEQRRLDEAMAILAEGLAGQPAQLGWAMTLARLQVDRGDLSAAGRTLAVAQPYGSGSADFQGFAGLVQHRLGNQRESAEHYQNAARIAPGDGRWWLGLGLALEAAQRNAEAREAYSRARATGSLNGDLSALVDQKLR